MGKQNADIYIFKYIKVYNADLMKVYDIYII